MPQIRDILKPKRLRLLRYLLEKILNTLILAFIFSTKILCLDNCELVDFSSSVNLWFLVLF